MSTRIGLFTHAPKKKKDSKTSKSLYVDVESLEALYGKLAELGARQVGLMCRDRTGGTRLEGKMFAVPELNDRHLAWLRAKPEQFETRALFFE